MFGFGMGELVVILLIVLVLFGASKLPEIGKSMGKAIQEFKKTGDELKKSIEDIPAEDDKKK